MKATLTLFCTLNNVYLNLFYPHIHDTKSMRLLMTDSKQTLQDLLDQCDESVPISKEEREWDKMHPVGKEFGSESDRNIKDKKSEVIELENILEEPKSQPKLETNLDDL